MNFRELVASQVFGELVDYTSTRAIYITYPFNGASGVRFGQPCFQNGGCLDDKAFLCTNEALIDSIESFIDGLCPESASVTEVVDHLLEVFSPKEMFV